MGLFGLPIPFLCSGFTDIGYVAAATGHTASTATLSAVDTAVTVAIALWQRHSTNSITNMQEEIADKQMALAEKLHAHAKLFWAGESRMVSDAFGIARAATDYSGVPTGWQGFATSTLSTTRQAWLAELSRGCMSFNDCEDARWNRESAAYQADTLAFGARQAEARAQTLRDVRYERQYYVVGLGHGILERTTGMQAAALSQAAHAQGVMFSLINQARAGVSYWFEQRQLREEGAMNVASRQNFRWTGYQPHAGDT